MATITSTTSGPFNSGSTWVGGVVPADRDSFIINYGHFVSVTGDQRRAAGFDDSYVRGKLHIYPSGQLRMSGILYVDNTAGYTSVFSSGNSSTAGFFRMDPGSILEIRGTNTEQHRLQVQAHGYVTCEIEGTNPNPQTTVSSQVENRGTSLVVADASKFAAGDWINVYKAERAGKDWQYYKSDEGVWIHDINYNTNTIYFREFVSATTNILSASGSNLTVNDASVFRVGEQVIFGTGNNLNIRSINDINIPANQISISGSISGTVVGQSMYSTGFEKYHASGDNVLRIAATTTQDLAVGTDIIPINNTNGFSVGDLIVIPRNDPVFTNGTTWDRIQDYTISAVNSGNKTITIGTPGYSNTQRGVATISIANPAVITLSNHGMLRNSRIIITTSGSLPSPIVANTPYYVLDNSSYTTSAFNIATSISGTPISTVGGTSTGNHYLQHYGLINDTKKDNLIINLTRDTKVRAPEGTIYGVQDEASFIFFAYFSTAANYYRRYKLKNFEMFLGSNTNSVEYKCLGIRGHNSFSLTQFGNYVSELDGITIRPSRRNTDNSGYLWEQHQLNMRNCVSYNSGGFGIYRYGNNTGLFNNISIRHGGWGYYNGGHYEPLSQHQYNYISNNSSGFGLSQNPDSTATVSHNYVLFSFDHPFYMDYNVSNFQLYKFYFNYFINWPRSERVGIINFVNSYFGNDWDVTGLGLYYNDSLNMYGRSYYSQERTTAFSAFFNSINHNFKYGNSCSWNRRALRLWDSSVGAWRVYPDRDDALWMGFDNLIFVPANSTVYLTGSVRTFKNLLYGSNTNYPYIRAQKATDYSNGKYFVSADTPLVSSSPYNTENIGFFDSTQYTSASLDNFETKTLTVSPQPYDYYLMAGIVCNGSANNSRLGWWEKDLEIIMTNPHPSLENQAFVNSLTTRKPIVIRSSLGTKKTRWGG
jgi:hypothetical protein